MSNLPGLNIDDKKKIEVLITAKNDARNRLDALDIVAKEIGGYLEIDKRIELGKAKIRKELIEIEDKEKAILFEHYKSRYGVDFARRMSYSIE